MAREFKTRAEYEAAKKQATRELAPEFAKIDASFTPEEWDVINRQRITRTVIGEEQLPMEKNHD